MVSNCPSRHKCLGYDSALSDQQLLNLARVLELMSASFALLGNMKLQGVHKTSDLQLLDWHHNQLHNQTERLWFHQASRCLSLRFGDLKRYYNMSALDNLRSSPVSIEISL